VLENQQLMPDIEVYNTPEERLVGKDAQIEAGVKHLLETIKNSKQQ
jgi:C-terminal processing protease CtpA/Prc